MLAEEGVLPHLKRFRCSVNTQNMFLPDGVPIKLDQLSLNDAAVDLGGLLTKLDELVLDAVRLPYLVHLFIGRKLPQLR